VAVNQKTVLIVEDDEASLDIFETILRHGGYDVLTAQSGAAGVETARETRPDLVVVDIGLPDGLGFGVLDELSDDPATEHIPLVVCTVHVFEQDRVRARRAGADVFLKKPIDPTDLLAAVDRLLAAAGSARETGPHTESTESGSVPSVDSVDSV
jgi:DNA-binding response OmpR family regulator